MAVNQARLGEVEWICIWIQVLQWKGDRARKVTFQPFGPATDIDELQRRAGLKSSDNLPVSDCRRFLAWEGSTIAIPGKRLRQ